MPVEDVASPTDEGYEFGSEDDADSVTSVSDTEDEGQEEADSAAEADAPDIEKPPAKRKRSDRLATPIKKRLLQAQNKEEEMKIAEGADALLNLAGIQTANIVPLRSAIPNNCSSSSNNNDNNNDSKTNSRELVAQS